MSKPVNISDYVGRRVLAMTKVFSSWTAVEEFRVLEVSMSGNYVRLMNHHGQKVWRPVVEVAIIETLTQSERAPGSGS